MTYEGIPMLFLWRFLLFSIIIDAATYGTKRFVNPQALVASVLAALGTLQPWASELLCKSLNSLVLASNYYIAAS